MGSPLKKKLPDSTLVPSTYAEKQQLQLLLLLLFTASNVM